MELSKRLQAVADLVTPGLRIADIGTDHAYVPVYLLSEGKNPSGIAMDINVGPLERARKHIGELLTDGELKTRLSDGMKELKTGEVQCAVIAGMGGGLVIKILSESREVADSLQECVLQPQSELEKVRTFLLEEQKICEEILQRLEREDSERIRERKKQIVEELEVIQSALSRIRQE